MPDPIAKTAPLPIDHEFAERDGGACAVTFTMKLGSAAKAALLVGLAVDASGEKAFNLEVELDAAERDALARKLAPALAAEADKLREGIRRMRVAMGHHLPDPWADHLDELVPPDPVWLARERAVRAERGK